MQGGARGLRGLSQPWRKDKHGSFLKVSCSSWAEHLPGIHKALGWIPTTYKETILCYRFLYMRCLFLALLPSAGAAEVRGGLQVGLVESASDGQ